MYVVWYDPDKRRSAHLKVLDACERYTEKFGLAAVDCLTSIPDAEELIADSDLPKVMQVRGIHYIPRYTFYVGVEEPT